MYLVNNIGIDKDTVTGVYGDKLDLLKLGYQFQGISFDDEWTVRRFLNGYKIKIDSEILNIFSDLEISYSLLKRKIKDLSKGQFKLILFVYSIYNKKNNICLDYFDIGLSYKYKKRIINYIKNKYKGTMMVISNDLVFLNSISSNLLYVKDGKVIYSGNFNDFYKKKYKIDYPKCIEFIRLANKKGAKLTYTVDNKELLKDIYRSVR